MTISKIPNTNSYPMAQDQEKTLNTEGGKTLQATPANHASPQMPSHHYHPSMIHDRDHHLHHGHHKHHHTHDPKRDRDLVAICNNIQ